MRAAGTVKMMKSTRPTLEGRVLLSAEVVVPVTGPCKRVGLVLSIPGREGTFERVWEVPSGVVDVAVYNDLCLGLEKAVVNALMLVGGVQETLPW